MTLFRRIVFAASLRRPAHRRAGHGCAPDRHRAVILQAEVYEKAADAVLAAPAAAMHEHSAEAMAAHAEHGWEPRDGLERTGYTLLADILIAVSHALLLAAAFALFGKDVSARNWPVVGPGRLHRLQRWHPGLGLPPVVPGTQAAPLLDRQLWWMHTALLTGGGLALLACRPLLALAGAGDRADRAAAISGRAAAAGARPAPRRPRWRINSWSRSRS